MVVKHIGGNRGYGKTKPIVGQPMKPKKKAGTSLMQKLTKKKRMNELAMARFKARR